MTDETLPVPGWRDRIKVHPAANLFPMMTDAELDAMGADIRDIGLQHGIVLWTPVAALVQGYDESLMDWFARTGEPLFLLDGRNRVIAVERENAKHPDRDEGDVVDYLLPLIEDLFSFEGEDQVPAAKLLMGNVDPYKAVISLNVHRRHLVDPNDILAKVLKARHELSNREIGRMVGRDHKTVAAHRAKLEDVGSIPHVETRTDTKGRQQPARKPATPKTPPSPAPTPAAVPEPTPDAAPKPRLRSASRGDCWEITERAIPEHLRVLHEELAKARLKLENGKPEDWSYVRYLMESQPRSA
jgi:hypothetical protein